MMVGSCRCLKENLDELRIERVCYERACAARIDPGHLIAVNPYDSAKLAAQFRYYGIGIVAPHRTNQRIKMQDERFLKRYRRRWKIARLFAWLQNFSAPGRAV
ncbi:MAG: hypothetical protein WCE52_21295 [Candidatus Acidiferrum sp.]